MLRTERFHSPIMRMCSDSRKDRRANAPSQCVPIMMDDKPHQNQHRPFCPSCLHETALSQRSLTQRICPPFLKNFSPFFCFLPPTMPMLPNPFLFKRTLNLSVWAMDPVHLVPEETHYPKPTTCDSAKRGSCETHQWLWCTAPRIFFFFTEV